MDRENRKLSAWILQKDWGVGQEGTCFFSVSVSLLAPWSTTVTNIKDPEPEWFHGRLNGEERKKSESRRRILLPNSWTVFQAGSILLLNLHLHNCHETSMPKVLSSILHFIAQHMASFYLSCFNFIYPTE